MNVYKVKRVYQSLQQVVKDKMKKQQDERETNNPHWLDQAIYQHKFKQMIDQKEIMDKSTYKLKSFKISKYSTVKLDYRPNKIEFEDPYFILTYSSENQGTIDGTIPYVDIFQKTGEPVRRINVKKMLKEHNVTLQNISHAKVPRLQWSFRQNVVKIMGLAQVNDDK